MRWIPLIFVVGCAHSAPPPQNVGKTHQPYSTLPGYLENPIAEHEMTPTEQVDRMGALLRDIDARAASLDENSVAGEQQQLQKNLDQLRDVVPPKPDLLVPIDRMSHVVEEMPKNPPEATRRRIWALTDLIRLRAEF